MSGIIAVVLDDRHHVVSVEANARHLVGTRIYVMTPQGSTAERVIFRVSGTERPLEKLYTAEETAERRKRVAAELARLMYETGSVLKSERWASADVDAFLDRLTAGVSELKRGLSDDFDPADPLRQWGAWFEGASADARAPAVVAAE
jgi:hypothetical protein